MDRKVVNAFVIAAVVGATIAALAAVLLSPASVGAPLPSRDVLPAPVARPRALASTAPVPEGASSSLVVRIAAAGGAERSGLQVVVACPAGGREQSGPMMRRFPTEQSWKEIALNPLEGEAALYAADAIPSAPRYLLAAWDEHGRVGAMTVDGRAGGSIDAGVLALEEPTGIDLTVVDPAEGHSKYCIRLRREPSSPTSPHADAWKYLVWRIAPEVFDAYDMPPGDGFDMSRRQVGHSLVVSAGGQFRISPLIPDRTASVVLGTRTGFFCDPRSTALERGSMAAVELSAKACLPEDALPCVEVLGRLVNGSDGSPVADARVIWSDVELAFMESTTDADGRFRFECVPAPADDDHGDDAAERHEGPHGFFRVVPRKSESNDDEKPLAAEEAFELHPEDVEEGRANVVWRLPSLGWLQVDLLPDRDADIRRRSSQGFPFQFFQRADGAIERPAATQYTSQGFRMACPAGNRVRGVVALSDFEILVTDEVDVRAGETAMVGLAAHQAPAKTPRLRLVDSYGENPLPKLTVRVRGLPVDGGGREFSSDANGIVVLPPVNLPSFDVVLPHGEAVPVKLSDADGVVDIPVPGP